MTQRSPFRRRSVAIIIAVCTASLGVGLFFVIFGGGPTDVRSAGPDSFSNSAIGHSALIRLLRRLEVPVLVSRHDSHGRARQAGLLIVAEPDPEAVEPSARELLDWLPRADVPVLLILPKRTGIEAPFDPGWLAVVEEHSTEVPQGVLDHLDIEATVTRVYSGDIGPDDWENGPFDAMPALDAPIQLVHSEQLEPLVWVEQGVLVGRIRSKRLASVIVISDPDLIANHGLGDGDNALLIHELIAFVRRGDRVVVMDETLHGFAVEPNIWRQLLDPPLVLATVQVGLLLLALVWGVTRRFGPPERAPPPLTRSKGFLISNTAELLRFGGHSSHSLSRYFQTSVQRVGHQLNAPSNLTTVEELLPFLQGLAERRRMAYDLSAIQREVDDILEAEADEPARVLAAAQKIHAWSRELVDGDLRHSTD